MINLVYEKGPEAYIFFENGKNLNTIIAATATQDDRTNKVLPTIVVLGKEILKFPCYFNIIEKQYIIKDLNFIIKHFKLDVPKEQFDEIVDNLYKQLLKFKPPEREISEQENNIFRKISKKILNFFGKKNI